MTTKYVSVWEIWKELSDQYDFDPFKVIEFRVDQGGGNSMDYEYLGDVPKRREE